MYYDKLLQFSQSSMSEKRIPFALAAQRTLWHVERKSGTSVADFDCGTETVTLKFEIGYQ